MGSTIDGLRRELRELERRVSRVERHLAIGGREGVGGSRVERAASEAEPEPEQAPEAARVPVEIAPPVREMEDVVVDSPEQRAVRWERLIGGRAFAVAGALIVIAGVALAFKLAYDMGWFAQLAPGARCWLGAGFGAALIGAGLLVQRRLGRAAAAGLHAAGIGAVYAAAYASYALYGLIEQPTALGLAMCIVALGVGISLYAGLASVAALAIIGGYLAPLLAFAPDAPAWTGAAHLLAMLATGLALSAIRGGTFSHLRTLVWWGTLTLGGVQAIAHASDATATVIAFVSIAWAMIHAELVFAAVRGRLTPAPLPWPRLPEWRIWWWTRAYASSLSASAWAGALGAFALFETGHPDTWAAPFIGFVATALVAAPLTGRASFLYREPAGDASRLGALLMVEAGAFLFAAIALGFEGWMEASVWLALGVAAGIAARWIHAPGLHAYGVTALGVATGRILFVEFSTLAVGNDAAPVEWAGFVLTRWSVLVGIAGVSWLALAALRSSPVSERQRTVRRALVGVGIVTAHLALLHPFMTGWAPALSMVSLALCASLAARGLGGVGLRAVGVVAIVIAAGHTMTATLWRSWDADPAWRALGLVVTEWTGVFWLVAAAAVGMLAIDPSRDRDAAAARVVPHAALAMALGMVSLFHDEADANAVCAGMLAIVLATRAIGSRTPWRSALGHVSIAGLLATLCAWVFADVRIGAPEGGGSVLAAWEMRDALLGLHPGLWVALGLTGALGYAAWRAPARERPLADACALIALAVLLTATSLEAGRFAALATSDETALRAAASIWWGAFGVGLIALGVAMQRRAARVIGLGLIVAGAGKAVLFDLADVSAGWRIASFIALGALMLAVAAGYLRVSRAAERTEA